MNHMRSSIIRLAYANPSLRPHLLPLLRTAMEHSSPEALKKYLKDHPNADPKNHTVKKAPEKAETSGGEGWKSDPKVQKASKEREKAEKELKQFDESFPNMKAELDKLTPKFEELRDKAYNKGYIGSNSGELSKNDIKQLKESLFSPEEDDLVSDYLYLKNEVAKGPPSKGARALYVERLEKATREEEEAIEAYEEEAANASYEKAMAEAKKKAPKKEGPGNKQASLRARVIRLAHARPELRAALLPLLRTAMEHSSPEALRNYLKEHPNADPKNHTVKKAPETSGGGETDPSHWRVQSANASRRTGDDWRESAEKAEKSGNKSKALYHYEEASDYSGRVVHDLERAVEEGKASKADFEKALETHKSDVKKRDALRSQGIRSSPR